MTLPADNPRPGGFLDRFLANEGLELLQSPGGYRIGDIPIILRRQRKVMIPLALLGPIVAAVVTVLTPSIYEGVVTVKIDNEGAKIIEGQNLDPVVALSDTSRYLATQAKLVGSRSLAMGVIDTLNLAKDDDFVIKMGAKPRGEDLPAGQRQFLRKEQAVKLLQDNVTMLAPSDNRIATISFRSRDAGLAAAIANAYAAKYVGQNSIQHAETNAYARKFLTQQVSETRGQLEELEQQAITYARTNSLIDTSDAQTGGDASGTGAARSVTTANLVAINASYISAHADRIAAEQRWYVAQRANTLDLPDARDNGSLQTLIQQRALAAAKLGQLRSRYGNDQPDVREVRAQLGEIEGQIASIGRSLKESIRNDYISASRREIELVKSRDTFAGQTLNEQEKRVRLNLIARNADTLRQQLADLLNRLNQATAAMDVDSNNIAIVDPAEVPGTPVLPSMIKNLLIGLAAGLAMAAIAAFLRELIDDTLHTPEDVESKLRLPFLGVTPDIAEADVPTEMLNSKSRIVESYASIRAAIDFSMRETGSKVLMITSGAPKEGKSTTAMAVAHDFERSGSRVLLIDADLRRPTIRRALGLSRDAAGLTDVLMHRTSVADAVITLAGSSLSILPLGKRVPNPVQLLSSNALDAFIAEVRPQYDIIIIDSAPVMGLADAPLLARVADAVAFVVEAGRAHNGLAKVAIRRMQHNGAHMLGVILTKFDVSQGRYGFGYGPYYHYAYDYRTTYGDDASDLQDDQA